MKKILSFFLVSAMMITMCTTAFAATTTDTGNKIDQKIAELQGKQQKISDRKVAVEAKLGKLVAKQNLSPFKQTINENLKTVITKQESSLSALEQFNQLRISIEQSLQSIKNSGQKLSDDTKAQLKSYNAQIKEIMSTMKDTKGQNKLLAKQNKTNIKNKDEAAIEDTFQQINSIQTARYDQIIEMNDILTQINTLLTQSL